MSEGRSEHFTCADMIQTMLSETRHLSLSSVILCIQYITYWVSLPQGKGYCVATILVTSYAKTKKTCEAVLSSSHLLSLHFWIREDHLFRAIQFMHTHTLLVQPIAEKFHSLPHFAKYLRVYNYTIRTEIHPVVKTCQAETDGFLFDHRQVLCLTTKSCSSDVSAKGCPRALVQGMCRFHDYLSKARNS